MKSAPCGRILTFNLPLDAPGSLLSSAFQIIAVRHTCERVAPYIFSFFLFRSSKWAFFELHQGLSVYILFMCLIRNPVGNAGFCFSRWPNPPGSFVESFLQQQQRLSATLENLLLVSFTFELEKLFVNMSEMCQRIIMALKAEKNCWPKNMCCFFSREWLKLRLQADLKSRQASVRYT